MARPKPRARKPSPKPRKKRPKSKRAPKHPPRPSARSAKRETKIDHALVARTLDLIAEHERSTTEALRRVGAAIIADYFGGDEDLAASNDPLKPKSFTKLADLIEDETTWTATDLRRAVKIEVVARTLPAVLAERIAPTYLAHLGAVDDPAKRVRLANDLASGTLRGRPARDAIARASGANPHGGRQPVPGPQKVIGALERTLEQADDNGDLDPADFRRIPDNARDALNLRARAVIDRVRSLADKFG